MNYMCKGHQHQVDIFLDKHDMDLPSIAEHRSYNGMTPLHYACRLQENLWVSKLIDAAPHVANMLTHSTSKPNSWTPLQCLVDHPQQTTGQALREIETMIQELVGSPMSLEALGNRTGAVERPGGKRSGGLTALHAVVSQQTFASTW